MGWTSIYQLFCGSLGTRVMTHSQMKNMEVSAGKENPLIGDVIRWSDELHSWFSSSGGRRCAKKQDVPFCIKQIFSLVGFKHDFYFPFHIWDVILPIDELIFFKMVIAPPTSSAWLTPTQGEIPRDPRVPEIIPDRKKRCCELLAYDLTNNKQDGDNNVGSGYRYVTAGWWFGTWILWLSIQLGMSSSQLTFIFFGRGRYTTNQTVYVKFHCHVRLQEGSGPLQPQGNRTESLLELLKTHLKTLDWHLESFPSITSSID